jgi:hypothetical protein
VDNFVAVAAAKSTDGLERKFLWGKYLLLWRSKGGNRKEAIGAVPVLRSFAFRFLAFSYF